MNDLLERFHRVLVEEITTKRPDYLEGPFTVAEIYQNLVPYGTHRDRIGVEMNGDYEDALLRLLAGEGGYLLLDSDHALRRLREELQSSNPNTGLYREFAAVDVRLGAGPPPVPQRLADPDPETEAEGEPEEEPVSVDELSPWAEEPAAPTFKTPPPPPPPPDACRWCRAELPHRASLKFCPFCGTDIHVVPCPSCGEELEPEWRFCVACGTEVSG